MLYSGIYFKEIIVYNSFLYGNGLSLATLQSVRNNYDNEYIRYLQCDDFIFEFANAESHKRILRDFLKYFKITGNSEIVHVKSRLILKKNIEKINTYGFERWVSKYMFSSNTEYKKIKVYIYFLYNYWFHTINELILKKKKALEIITNIGSNFMEMLEADAPIYTTNFDTLLDSIFNPHHIHGIFQLPLMHYNDIIAFHLNEELFEYKYLFGSNGLEKLSRLDIIRKHKVNAYDIDFFYKQNVDLGSLLIYGLAFGKTEILTDEFLSAYPQYKDNKLVGTVDGHILLRLSAKYNLKELKNITIAYYSDLDKDNYQELFSGTNLEEIIEYKQCDDIININDPI